MTNFDSNRHSLLRLSLAIFSLALLAGTGAQATDGCGFDPTDEVADPLTAVAPIYHESGWTGERHLPGYMYAPAYTPNVVSFNDANVPFMRVPRSLDEDFLDVQRLDTSASCDWHAESLAPALAAAGWNGSTDERRIHLHFTRDQRVVFDDGDRAYTFVGTDRWPSLLVPTLAFKGAGDPDDWTAFKLDQGDWIFGRVQPRSLHGTMAHPPLVVLRQHTLTDLGLVAPTIDGGQLQVPAPIVLDPAQTGFSARFAVSHGDRSFIVWASQTYPADLVLPATGFRPGTPTYIQEYDHVARELLGQPVFLGYAGGPVEGAPITQRDYPPNPHNVPTIDIDSEGYLHVVLGGHHRSSKYTRSLQPLDVNSGWTPLEILGGIRDQITDPVDPADPTCERRCYQYTYPSLLVDEQDNLHLFSRWSGKPEGELHYYMRIAYQRKPAGQPWEPRRTLVRPFRTNYSHWYQTPAVDRLGRLFLSYIHYGNCLSPEDAASYQQKYGVEELTVDRECSGGAYYEPVSEHEPVVLMSDDHGDSWRLATTADFADGLDPDLDRVGSGLDNCPQVSNRDQLDFDDDGLGNACDPSTAARALMQGSIEVASSLLPTDDPGTDASIAGVIQHIWLGLRPFWWLDDSHLDLKKGGWVFHQSRRAVVRLTELLDVDNDSDSDGNAPAPLDPVVESALADVLGYLILAVDSLAQVLLEDAENAAVDAGCTPPGAGGCRWALNRINHGLAWLENARESVAQGSYAVAIHRYKWAWHLGARALKLLDPEG